VKALSLWSFVLRRSSYRRYSPTVAGEVFASGGSRGEARRVEELFQAVNRYFAFVHAIEQLTRAVEAQPPGQASLRPV
jgi:hypothetical protein